MSGWVGSSVVITFTHFHVLCSMIFGSSGNLVLESADQRNDHLESYWIIVSILLHGHAVFSINCCWMKSNHRLSLSKSNVNNDVRVYFHHIIICSMVNYSQLISRRQNSVNRGFSGQPHRNDPETHKRAISMHVREDELEIF